MKKQKTFVFALDGASWNMLDKVFHTGLMPTLQTLSEENGRGEITSTSPPATLPAWMDFALGVDSGTHGVSGLTEPGEKLGEFSPYYERSTHHKTFYEKLDDKGKRCILINFPAAFPLHLVNGIGLASFINAGDKHYFPESLADDFPEVEDYEVFPDFAAASAGLVDPFDEYLRIERKRFSLAKKLVQNREWDFFFYLISSFDWIFHKIDGQKFDEVLNNEKVRALFTEFDDQLTWFLENAPDTQFILMSDHGEKQFDYQFYPNVWLVKNGYLSLDTVTYKNLDHVSFDIKIATRSILESGSRLSFFVRVFNRFPFLYSLLGLAIRRLSFAVPRFLIRNRIGDWGLHVNSAESTAHFYGGFYVNTSLSITKVRELARQLRSITLPRSKNKVFSKVIVSSDYFKGAKKDTLPDIILESETCVMNPALWSTSLFQKGIYYNHRKRGMYMEVGKKYPMSIPISQVGKRILKNS